MNLLTVDYREEIIKAAQAHAQATGRSKATISNLIAKDRHFISRLENGGGCTVDTFQNVMRWFKVNTPNIEESN